MNLIPHAGERGLTEFRPARLPAPAGPVAPRPFFDFNRLLSILRRRARLMALIFLAVFLAILIPALAQPKLYKATALVVLDQRQANITNTPQVLSGLPEDSNIVDTEVEILKSRQLAEHVMDKLNLDADPEFGGDPQAAAAADAKRGALDGAERTRRSGVVDAITGRLQVQRVGLTYMMSIAFESMLIM